MKKPRGFGPPAGAQANPRKLTPEDLGGALELALQYCQAGQWSQAEAILQQILQVQPGHPDALLNLGVLVCQRGDTATAVDFATRATRSDPGFVEAHYTLGRFLEAQEKLDEAAASYRQALALRPGYAEAHYNLGLVLNRQGELQQAATSHRAALALVPDFAEAHNELGIILEAQGEPAEEVACYRRALVIKPDLAEAHNNLGVLLETQGNLEEAAANCHRAIALRPDSAQFHYNLGRVLMAQQKLEMAEARYRQALSLKPDYAEAHDNLAGTLLELSRFTPALDAYRQALRLKPQAAQTHCNYALALLLTGDLEAGWAEYEWRWHQQLPADISERPVWDGSPGLGTILLYSEQGLGDTLQFIRYAPLVKAQGVRVVVACDPSLTSLLASCAGIDDVVASGSALPDFDAYVLMMSLPHRFSTRLDTIPATVSYLRAPACRLPPAQQAHLSRASGLKIGLVWSAKFRHSLDYKRYCPLAHFEPLLRTGASFFSLYRGERLADLEPYQGQIVELGSHFEDFGDTAWAIAQLDLIITVDTSVAHLAGAMGKPTWVLLPCVPDWRWLLGREDSPWYPTARLFRQPRPGEWAPVLEQVYEALKAFEP
ncbi:MAG: tetratricopeptide repeat protein [Gemmatimonadaceae bacterium]|nr:tetratricopeptide repeat protein [Gloeobacterales cyanobacterium ES-bin-141]